MDAIRNHTVGKCTTPNCKLCIKATESAIDKIKEKVEQGVPPSGSPSVKTPPVEETIHEKIAQIAHDLDEEGGVADERVLKAVRELDKLSGAETLFREGVGSERKKIASQQEALEALQGAVRQLGAQFLDLCEDYASFGEKIHKVAETITILQVLTGIVKDIPKPQVALLRTIPKSTTFVKCEAPHCHFMATTEAVVGEVSVSKGCQQHRDFVIEKLKELLAKENKSVTGEG